jgi:hypothetical protein
LLNGLHGRLSALAECCKQTTGSRESAGNVMIDLREVLQ